MSSPMDSNSGQAPGDPHATGTIEDGDLLDRLRDGAHWAEAAGRPRLAGLLRALHKHLVSLDSDDVIEELQMELSSLEDDVVALQRNVSDVEDEVASLRYEFVAFRSEIEGDE